tara:strand:+ start:664 stop:1260 length:597 start_codon:yes stop_codon:yes gene_type:complete
MRLLFASFLQLSPRIKRKGFVNKAATLSLLFLFAQPLSAQSTELYGLEFFESPPRNISIHNSYSNAYQRSYPVISLELPVNAGANLKRISLSQINGTERWKWRGKDLSVYSGFYNMRKRGEKGLASIQFNNESGITEIVFTPSIKPGQIVSVVIPSINPKQGVYEWSASFYPESPSLLPSQTLGPVLRLDIYRSNIRF